MSINDETSLAEQALIEIAENVAINAEIAAENTVKPFTWSQQSASVENAAKTAKTLNRNALLKALNKRIGQADVIALELDADNAVILTIAPLTVTITEHNQKIVKTDMSGDLLVKLELLGENKAQGYRSQASAILGRTTVLKMRVNVINEAIYIADKDNVRGDEIGYGYMHEYTDTNKVKQTILLNDLLVQVFTQCVKFENRVANNNPPVNHLKDDGKDAKFALLDRWFEQKRANKK